MNAADNAEALVVGAGPAGLFAAALDAHLDSYLVPN